MHIASTVDQVHDAQRWVRAYNFFILNHLLLRNFAKFVAYLLDVHDRLFRYAEQKLWNLCTATHTLSYDSKIIS